MRRQPLALNAPTSDQLKVMAIDNPYNPYGSRFYSPTGAPNSDGTARLTGNPQAITLLGTLRSAASLIYNFNDLRTPKSKPAPAAAEA